MIEYTVADLSYLLKGYPQDAKVFVSDIDKGYAGYHIVNTSKEPGMNGPVVFLHIASSENELRKSLDRAEKLG